MNILKKSSRAWNNVKDHSTINVSYYYYHICNKSWRSNTERNSFKCILYIELNNFQNTSEQIILSSLSTQKQMQKKKSKVWKSLTIEPVVLWNVSSDVMVVMSRPKGPRECSIFAKEIRSCSRVEVLICKGEKNTQDF